MRLVRHGAVHWNSMRPKLRNAFLKHGARTRLASTHVSWKQQDDVPVLREISEFLLYILAIQGHNGGNLMAPGLFGHVAIPYEWKELLLHRGCSFNCTSILQSGLVAGGRVSRDGRQTVFFTRLNPFGDNPDEEHPTDDLSIPRKVHYHSKWKTNYSGRRLLGQYSPGTGQRITILADKV